MIIGTEQWKEDYFFNILPTRNQPRSEKESMKMHPR